MQLHAVLNLVSAFRFLIPFRPSQFHTGQKQKKITTTTSVPRPDGEISPYKTNINVIERGTRGIMDRG